MLSQIFICSLICTGLYICFQQGNILGFVRIAVANFLDRNLDRKWSKYIQKPLWDCMACMASVWTILFTWSVDIGLILAVCGLNAIISTMLVKDEDIMPDAAHKKNMIAIDTIMKKGESNLSDAEVVQLQKMVFEAEAQINNTFK